MTVSAGKLAGGMLLLVGVWIAVYWMWEPREPRISFASGSNPTALPAPVVPLEAPPQGPPAAGPGVSGVGAGAGAEPSRDEIDPPRPSVSPAPAAGTPPTRPEPRPEIKVKPPEFWEYEVRAGETLQTISRNFYGTPTHASAIARANPLMDPTKMKAGRLIRIPRDPTNIQGIPQTDARPVPEPPTRKAAPVPTPASSARRTHTVVEGETLSAISKRYYGTAGRTGLIYQANRDKLKSEDDLRIGIELVIPDPAP